MDTVASNQTLITEQVKANGHVVAQLTLRRFAEEALSDSASSGSVVFEEEAPFTHLFADDKGKNTMKPSSSKKKEPKFDDYKKSTHREPKAKDTRDITSQKQDKLPHHVLPKMQFPSFFGENPKLWITKCHNYFNMYSIPDELWIQAATMHLQEDVAMWWEAYKVNNPEIPWSTFSQDIQSKFGSDDYRAALAELVALKQIGTIEDYTTQFHKLQYKITMHNAKHEELYFVTQYVAGLKDDIKAVIEPQVSLTVDRAALIAKIQ